MDSKWILNCIPIQYNQQDATFFNILYCCQSSTCFRRVFRPASGAKKNCTHSIWYRSSLSVNSPTLGLAASKLDIYQMPCVQFLSSWWWAENRLKHVQHWQQWRILYKVASCSLYLKEYINDARYHERQIKMQRTSSPVTWPITVAKKQHYVPPATLTFNTYYYLDNELIHSLTFTVLSVLFPHCWRPTIYVALQTVNCCKSNYSRLYSCSCC